ncbi:MAG: hydantoinase/oxoprolinase family protein [Chloroflexi bacterium]|nr:hydantoinase/oxoprolinase family protein [Chloroflexota bacterium]
MAFTIGIDTGGSHTDAVLFDPEAGQVVRAGKAPTTRYNLAVGIAGALDALGDFDPVQVQLVCISTTLATNATVEGKGGRVALLLLGYDPQLIEIFHLKKDLVVEDIVFLPGRHDLEGEEVQPLDLDRVREAVLTRMGRVDAFAVSSYLAVRNPEHEVVVRDLIRSITDLPVVCGHDLTDELNSIVRATTTVLNARLIPFLHALMTSVRAALAERGLTAPLMVVKGDGSLFNVEEALKRPIETALSGPSASALGGLFLGGLPEAIVSDMGGTTTDIARLVQGQPRVQAGGAVIGGYRTAVRAADTYTLGLGGDSRIAPRGSDALSVGPQRVVPLAIAASRYPTLTSQLRVALSDPFYSGGPLLSTDFLGLAQDPGELDLSDDEATIVDFLRPEPAQTLRLLRKTGLWARPRLSTERLERLGIVEQIGFTPTDALHAEGSDSRGDVEAATLGVRLFANRMDWQPAEVIREVRSEVTRKAVGAILEKVLLDASGRQVRLEGTSWDTMLRTACRNNGSQPVGLRLASPIVAVGAPAAAFYPEIARALGTSLVIPPNAGVANAVGAVVGSIVEAVHILIEPTYERLKLRGFVLHTPDERSHFATLPEAVAYAERIGPELARARAEHAGATSIEVRSSRVDDTFKPALGPRLHLETNLTFIAVGRPAFKAAPAPVLVGSESR